MMSWIKIVPEADARGSVAEAYAHIRRQNGSISNITRAASINPGVMRALADLLHALRGPAATLDRRRQEMIAVLTSALHRCAY
jgi:alkylhydroperoxidase family enzyme